MVDAALEKLAQGAYRPAVPAGDRLGMDEGADHRFLDGLGGGQEDRVDGVLVEHPGFPDLPARVVGDALRRGEGDDHVPGAVPEVAAHADEPHPGPPAEPAELACVQGNVGGENDDERAPVVRGAGSGGRRRGWPRRPVLRGFKNLSYPRPDRVAGDREPVEAPEIGEDEGAHRILRVVEPDTSRGAPDAALEAEAAHAPAGPDGPFPEVLVRRGQGVEHVRLPHVHAPDVVQESVVTLAYDGIDGARDVPDVGTAVEHEAHFIPALLLDDSSYHLFDLNHPVCSCASRAN